MPNRPQVRRSPVRAGFTLIELLVVIAIIGILIALLIPGVQAARNAARNNSSKNNLRQITLAFSNFEASKRYYPPSWQPPDVAELNMGTSPPTDVAGWSIMALILPYLEQKAVASNIDFELPYNQTTAVSIADGRTVQLSSLRIPTYLSPAEPRDEPRFGGTSNPQQQHYPFNYAVNLGTWFVWDPATNRGGYGAAYPNSRLRDSDFFDGTTSTMAFAEVKAWQPYFRNSNLAAMDLDEIVNGFPTTADICGWGLPNELRDSGHTEWVDGRAHHAGFTTTFGPNEWVMCSGTINSIAGTYDVDFNNRQEGLTLNATMPTYLPTYAAVTARSYFPGQVNVSMVDGSVRSISDTINLGVWRALSTRAGKELLPDSTFKE
jgi:prepilin-type N-terminal cleavage/methylation domain-containing protein/prepilin-type processing-associated H-X9-DG protein